MPMPTASSHGDRRAYRATPATINARSQQSSSYAADVNISGTQSRGHTPLLPPIASRPLSSNSLSTTPPPTPAQQQLKADSAGANESKENANDVSFLSEGEIDELMQQITSETDRKLTREQIVATQSRLMTMTKRRDAIEEDNVVRSLTMDIMRTRMTVDTQNVDQTSNKADKTTTSTSKASSADDSALMYQTHVYLDDARLRDITLLSSFHHITHLYLQHNQITDISCLSHLSHLRFAVFHHNLITDISIFNTLKRLQFLDISYNLIDDFDPILLPEYIQIMKFKGNDCCQHEQFLHHVLAECPYLIQLDDQTIDDELRKQYGLEDSHENNDDQNINDLLDDLHVNDDDNPFVDEFVMSSDLKQVIDQMQNSIRNGMESLTNITDAIRQHIEVDDDDIHQNIQNKSGLIEGAEYITEIMQRIRNESDHLMQQTTMKTSTLPSTSAYLELLDDDER